MATSSDSSCMILVSVLVYKAHLYSNKEKLMQLLTQATKWVIMTTVYNYYTCFGVEEDWLMYCLLQYFLLVQKCLVLGSEFLSPNPLHREHTFGPLHCPCGA